MAKRPALSKAEVEIARVLSEKGPASVRQVHEILCTRKSVDFSTVQTYLRRLESKGYAKTKLDGRIRIYSLRVKASTVIRETVNDLIERMFAGQTMPLMRHLVEDGKVTKEELAELRELVDSIEKGARDE